jgi:hypothetical protein
MDPIPRRRKIDLLLASVARTPAVAPAAARRLPRLTSRQARQVSTLAPCAACGGSTRRMWRCRAEPGPVVLCETCKLAAFDDSFGSIDAASLSEPSAIESNRRRH